MKKIKEILTQTIKLLEGSKESDWSPLTPKEVIKNLEAQIERLERGEEPERDLLALEFAPTSTIQEISMLNGWSIQYLELSTQLDQAISNHKKST